jgi:hypothetical protein
LLRLETPIAENLYVSSEIDGCKRRMNDIAIGTDRNANPEETIP